ncbi:MAG: biopolymer transport protein ExbB [Granulosicoccus sp.]|jgi:biopolymer transport protein ExbB
MTHPPHADPALSTLLLDSVDITDTFSLDARLQQVSETVTSSLALGGPVSALLILMSMVSVAIILFKSIELTQETLRDRHQIRQALVDWKQGRNHDATRCLSDAQVGLGRILWVAMQGSQTSNISEAALREEIQRLAANTFERLRRYLKVLENIGSISPLLGLFGTVLGMIKAFQQMETAGSQVDPAALSGGIWQALLTTGVGLAVAIPTVLAHQWLERRVDAHVHTIEDFTTQVFTSNTIKRIESQELTTGTNIASAYAY